MTSEKKNTGSNGPRRFGRAMAAGFTMILMCGATSCFAGHIPLPPTDPPSGLAGQPGAQAAAVSISSTYVNKA